MNLNQLEYFLKVAETGSFSHAAESLFLAQPSLSQSIKKLEDELGVRLFVRGSRKMFLTPQGREFVSTAKSILAARDNYICKMEEAASEVCGTISIGVPTVRGSIVLPRILPVFMSRYPKVQVEIEEDYASRVEEKVASGQLDLCIINDPIISSYLERIALCEERIVLITSRRSVPVNPNAFYQSEKDSIKTVSLKHFENYNFIMINHHRKLYGICKQIFKEANVSPNILFECQDCNTIIRLVAENIGLALMIDSGVSSSGFKRDLISYYIEEWPFTWTLNICYRSQLGMKSATKAFLGVAKEVFNEGIIHLQDSGNVIL